jgi:hypothetical protein
MGRVLYSVWWENQRKRDFWGDPGLDGWIILRRSSGKWYVVGMDCIELVQDRDTWQGLVNAVMNHQVPKSAENFLTSCKTVSFSKRNLLHGVSE